MFYQALPLYYIYPSFFAAHPTVSFFMAPIGPRSTENNKKFISVVVSIYFFKLFPSHHIILKDFWTSIELWQNAYPLTPPLTQYFTECQNWKSFVNVGFGKTLVGSKILIPPDHWKITLIHNLCYA